MWKDRREGGKCLSSKLMELLQKKGILGRCDDGSSEDNDDDDDNNNLRLDVCRLVTMSLLI